MTYSAKRLDSLLELRAKLIDGGLDPATAQRETAEAGRRLGYGEVNVETVAERILAGSADRPPTRTEALRDLVAALQGWGLSDDDALEGAMAHAHRLQHETAAAVAQELIVQRAAERKRAQGGYGEI